MTCRMDPSFLTTGARLFPGEVNRWIVALVPTHGIWDGSTVPTDDQVGKLVSKFLKNVVLQEILPEGFSSSTENLKKFTADRKFMHPTMKRPAFWTGALDRVPPLSASFYASAPINYDKAVPTVYVGVEFFYKGLRTQTHSWPWGGKHSGSFITTWCPENVHYGALMAVLPPKGKQVQSVKTLTTIPATPPAPAPSPSVVTPVDLGTLPAMIVNIPGPAKTSMLLPVLGLGALAYWAMKRK